MEPKDLLALVPLFAIALSVGVILYDWLASRPRRRPPRGFDVLPPKDRDGPE